MKADALARPIRSRDEVLAELRAEHARTAVIVAGIRDGERCHDPAAQHLLQHYTQELSRLETVICILAGNTHPCLFDEAPKPGGAR